jgi:epoxyqueuosine reductase
LYFDVQLGIHRRQMPGCAFGPFHQLEAGAGEKFAEPGIFPFSGVRETVEVKVPDVQRRAGWHERARLGLVGLNHRIGGALDAALHAERAQQMANKGGFARTQITVQREGGQANLRVACQAAGKRLGIGLTRPLALPCAGGCGTGRRFYNVPHMGTITTENAGMDAAAQLVSQIQAWGRELSFSQIGVSDVNLSAAEPGFLAWLAQGFHGEMAYMAHHGLKRARPAELVPGTVSVITARMDYLPRDTPPDWPERELARLQRPGEAIVSVYARGRDYHKVLRARLQKLAERLAQAVGPLGHRVFTDSAPVLEAELARRSGQGWRGKHTLVLNRAGGSMFFLGEIYVDLSLPADAPVSDHCGACSACIDACPTGAIVAPHRLDARRCISYLTIEHPGEIPLALRPLMGNRIYGCDDCQLVCPWNKFAQRSPLADFDPREGLRGSHLVDLFGWSEAEFLSRTEGSPIRRIGHERWLRNIAVALGNALRQSAEQPIRGALEARAHDSSALVRSHVAWALMQ